RAEDGLEGVKLAPVAYDVFQLREVVVEEERPLAHSRDRTAFSRLVAEDVLAGGVEVNHLKVSEVDRVGAGRPDSSERFGVGDLKPKAAPAARGMAVDEPRTRVGEYGEGSLDVGDQFSHQGFATRAIRGRVGENVVAGATVGVEHHADQVIAEAEPAV